MKLTITQLQQLLKVNGGKGSCKNKRRELEHGEQKEFFRWAELSSFQYPVLRWMYAVPNGWLRHPVTAQKLQNEGVKPGVPDIMLPYPISGHAGLYIEMKRLGGGEASGSQGLYIKFLQAVGYRVEICHGWKQAQDVVVDYLREFNKEAYEECLNRAGVSLSDYPGAMKCAQGGKE